MNRLLPFATLFQEAVRLGLSPQTFWQLSLREVVMLFGPPSEASLNRQRLDALIALYPDKEKNYG